MHLLTRSRATQIDNKRVAFLLHRDRVVQIQGQSGTEEEVSVAIQAVGVHSRSSLPPTAQGIPDIPAAIDGSLQDEARGGLSTPTWWRTDGNKEISFIRISSLPHHTKICIAHEQPTEACKELRKARSIGVSSYLRSRIETTLRTARDLPLLNIEHHPYLQHANDYLPWLRGNGIQWRRSYVSSLR
ncbi:hypothetical protein MY4824_007666 [Beauveria thailandica]